MVSEQYVPWLFEIDLTKSVMGKSILLELPSSWRPGYINKDQVKEREREPMQMHASHEPKTPINQLRSLHLFLEKIYQGTVFSVLWVSTRILLTATWNIYLWTKNSGHREIKWFTSHQAKKKSPSQSSYFSLIQSSILGPPHFSVGFVEGLAMFFLGTCKRGCEWLGYATKINIDLSTNLHQSM